MQHTTLFELGTVLSLFKIIEKRKATANNDVSHDTLVTAQSVKFCQLRVVGKTRRKANGVAVFRMGFKL